ncbi:MAG: type IV pilus assembly protein PilM [Armatimonadetes bacterium]|nr:type IV pilus assembly protein PilM [Armatimonadota bacterium]
MNFSLFSKGATGRTLGVDIGHDNLKVVEVEIGRNRMKIHKAGMAPTPIHAVVEGQVVMPEAVGMALRELLTSMEVSSRTCIGSVTGANVTLRPIEVPRQKPADLSRTLAVEAQKYLSTTPEENYIEAPILPLPHDAEPGADMPVLLVAAPRPLVDGRVQALEMAGLDPIAMDVNALAMIRALLPHVPEVDSDETPLTVAFVDLGASYTEVTIVHGQTPVFTRTIPIGGTSFTNALAGVLGVDFDEAQSIKHALSADTTEEGGPDATASRVIHSLLEELVRDIRRSLAYYASTLDWESIEGLVDRVVLLGGGSQLVHTADYFGNVLQMNVVTAELPDDGVIQVAPEAEAVLRDHQPTYLIAIGLGLWPLYTRSEKL